MTSPIHTRDTPRSPAGAICHTQSITLTTHGDRVERRRRRQRHARADGFGRGGAATAWAAAAPSATSAPSAQLERGQAQGSVAARGSAAAVASRRAARARRGGQVIGRRVMGRRVTPASDRRRADRCSAAADLEGVRSATVGVGGRPSCGEEGGRQVRVVRVALHRPVERRSSRDRSKA